MAERRMFAKGVINSDTFGDMPLSSQALYFNLGINADDDGFVNNAKQIRKMIGASEDDLKLLVAKRYIISFDTGVVVIRHWLIHNQIRKDRYKPTNFVDEKKQLSLIGTGEYELTSEGDDNTRLPIGIPTDNQMETQYSIGKDSIGKVSVDECKCKLGNEILTIKQYEMLVSKYGQIVVDEMINRIITHPYYGCLNEKTISQWCMQFNRKKNTKKNNSFMNYQQRECDEDDMVQLERKLLRRG